MTETSFRSRLWPSAASIVLAAFLLFAVEPLVAKRLLPWFGGTAAVWTTCLVFYQVALLAGYFYANLLTRYCSPRVQAVTHVSLLAISLLFLPIGPGTRWTPGSSEYPAGVLLQLLAATIGMPFALLATTTPLLQQWLAQERSRPPYWLFAISNVASLAALLLYPLVIEPSLDLTRQRSIWSWLYAGWAILCGSVAWRAARAHSVPAVTSPKPLKHAWLAFSLSACGSMLLLSITNHITQNVAAVPLLWVVPLALYLLTFILSFAPRSPYKRVVWLRLLAMAIGLMGYATYDIATVEAIQISLPVFLFGLFAACFFCHGELAALQPVDDATRFYLVIAAGGAAGAITIGLLAPLVFAGIYELPWTLALTAVLVSIVTWKNAAIGLRALWPAIALAMFAVFLLNVQAYRANSLVLERSFYGSLRVVQTPRITEQQTRTLFHGTIEHGEQFLWPTLRMRPTSYYGPDSGIGIVLRECYDTPKHVAVIGLGTGTIAAYGSAADEYKFFEINPQVERLATTLFYFLRLTPAKTSVLVGDGRLLLQQQPDGRYDVIAIDAFSGDAIPVHLLTREAFSLYQRKLKPGGTLAFHVSNQYLDLASVVQQLAHEAGFSCRLIRNHQDLDNHVNSSDWAIVTRNLKVLQNASLQVHTLALPTKHLRPWTDSYNNLLQVFRIPEMR